MIGSGNKFEMEIMCTYLSLFLLPTDFSPITKHGF